MTLHRFAFPTPIVFGAGARREVSKHLLAAGIRRPLLVTDEGLAKLPVLAGFLSDLTGLEVAVFSGIRGNPTGTQVAAGAEAYRAHGADAVIGFGGGAALDVAKVVAMMAVHPGQVLEYAWDHPEVRAITAELPYFVAVPTTSGTGSEVGRSSVISDDETHLKKIVFSAKLLARAVFADPELTLDMPAAITASTGMDALTHNVESYLSPDYHPMCDGIALEGVRIAARSLAKAVREPRNLEARTDMMMASLMGAVAFQKDLGATHSCAHALSTVADLHHGLANGIMIDHVMRFNQSAATEKMAELAHVAGVAKGDAEASAAAFIAWLGELKAQVNVPAKLSAVGVTSAQIEALVKVAVDDICHKTNPRPCSADDFRAIFAAAI